MFMESVITLVIVVPGLPLIGNLLQLKAIIPHQILTNWAEIYGPIYKTGASTIVVLNSTDVALVTKFSFIPKRKLTYPMNKLANNIMITSDSNEYHKMARRHVVTNMLGAAHAKENPLKPVNFRLIFQTEIFGLALKQALGTDIGPSKYIEGLGETLSRDEILKVLVLDPLWVPNKNYEMHIGRIETRRLEDHLYREIQKVCGNNKYTEEMFSEVTYLGAVFHETLRKYPALPVGSPRCAHEDIYSTRRIIINFYGCNMNKKQWDSPEKWKPERFLDSKHDPKDLYKTLSFEGGRRICQILITCTAIARCTQEFKWNLEPGTGEEDITPKLNPSLAIITARE
ncbi:hypothetical protein MKW92_021198 [Papaver armeniacum]|nr:hypothetical protein MKW92_021198 [Papaver armeniacum]